MKEERKKILKMVEQGMLSADEAVNLIEQLEKEYRERQEEKINALSVEVLSEEKKEGGGRKQSKVSILTSKLLDLVDTAVQKVREMDIDIPIGPSVHFTHIFQLQQLEVDELSVHIVNGNVNIEPWDESDIRVECDVKAYKVEDEQEARDYFLQNAQCEMEGKRFIFFVDKKVLKVNATLYVPNKLYNSLKVKLFNGPIRGEGLKVENVKVKTANGMISLKGFEGKNAELETANGQIKWTGFSYDHVELETVNGMIDINGEAEKLDLQSFNGNLLVSIPTPVCQTLYAKTTTGNIELKVPNTMDIIGEFKSHLGSFSYDEEAVVVTSQRNDVLQKEMRFNVKGEEEKKLTLFAEAKTGSITLS